MRKIRTLVVVKALTKFFSLFGLPKVVQTDQGSNFMSRMFAQVLKQLNIKHGYSSAYHPESQGAVERFHQTLKTMLRTYCLEFEKDWDEGVHLQMFAIREVVQESLGFSPSELIFAHTVRGPLKLLKDKWLCGGTEQNLLDYVCNFRLKLRRACEIAKDNLEVAQIKMKTWFDRHAKVREFQPGDKVLVLLPIPGASLQARYSGPYAIQKKVGDRDYLVTTPDRRRGSRLCHVNMLKGYVERTPSSPSRVTCETAVTPVVLSGTESAVSCLASVKTTAALPVADEGGGALSEALTQGKLLNSEVLNNLHSHLSYLSDLQRSDLVKLFNTNKSLFLDVPSQTTVLMHDVDIGDTRPIKQHPYRVNPDKCSRLKQQVQYMLDHNIGVPLDCLLLKLMAMIVFALTSGK